MAPVASGSKPGGKLTPLEAKIVKVGLQAQGGSISQQDLLAQCGLTISPTTQDAINSLLRKNLLQMLKTSKGTIEFRFVAKDEAKAMGSMDSEEKLVFDQIKAAGNMGIWTKNLTTDTGLPRTTITKVLKTLEGRKTVKTVKSVKAPTRKIYMLANLTPSVELTGGPWFTDNELDTEFVDLLKKCAYKYLETKSIPKPKNGQRRIYPVSATRFLPTVAEIRHYIDSLGVAVSVELQDVHVGALLDLMVYDGTVEKIFINSDMAVNGVSNHRPHAAGGGANGQGGKGKEVKRKRGRKAVGSDEESSDEEGGGGGRRKGKRGANGRPASKKRKGASGKGLVGDDSEPSSGSDSEELDSDEDAGAARRRKEAKEEEGEGRKSSKRRKKRAKRAKRDPEEEDEEDRVTSESSGHETESDGEGKKGGKKGVKKLSAEEEAEIERENMKDYVYRLVRPYQPVVGWTDMPCGKCPSEAFCSEPTRPLAVKQAKPGAARPRVGIELEGGIQGVGMIGGAGAAIGVSTAKWGEVKGAVGSAVAPVNPRDCHYFKEWLEF